MRFKLVAAAVCLVASLSSVAAAQTPAKRPMTFADLQAMKRISDPQISPSGKWVLFSVTEVSLEKNTKVNHLWVVPLDGSAKERQITTGDGEANGRFAPNGKTISLTMKDQIFEMPWDETAGKVGAAVQVTNVNGGADGAIWSPDSKRLLFVVSVFPECSDLGDWSAEDACDVTRQTSEDASPVKAQIFTHLLYRHWNAYTGDRRSHIAVVDSDTGRHLRDLTPRSVVGDAETPTFSLGGPLGYAWAPDGKEIAYETNLDVGLAKPDSALQPGESTNNDIFILNPDAEPRAALRVSSSPGSDDGPAYSPDGKWLAWRSQARNGYENDKFDLVVMDRATGKTRKLDRVQRDYSKSNRGEPSILDMWIDEFAWSDTSKEIFFVSASHGEAPIYSIGVDGVELHRYGKAIGEWGGISIARVNGNFELVAGLMRVDQPTEIAAFDAVGMDDSTRTINIALDGSSPNQDVTVSVYTPKHLTHLNDALLSQLSLSPLEPFWFTGAEGTKVEGFVVKPPNFDASKKYPVKFLMHGGPQTAWGDAWSYRWNPELFAAEGYVVVMVNRRGSTGYGQKFLEQVSGDWGGRAFEDLMKGLDYAEKTFPFIDKDRECALGASYGGFMANWVLTHTDRFKCIVTHDGMYNPQSAFGTTEELWFNEWEFRPKAATGLVEQTVAAHPWDFFDEAAKDDPFRKYSPMQYIKNAKTPTLVIHGQRDYRLDVSEGLQLFTALQLLHVPSKMLYFPNEGHWVLTPQDSQLWYKTVDDWCDQWTHSGKYAMSATH